MSPNHLPSALQTTRRAQSMAIVFPITSTLPRCCKRQLLLTRTRMPLLPSRTVQAHHGLSDGLFRGIYAWCLRYPTHTRSRASSFPSPALNWISWATFLVALLHVQLICYTLLQIFDPSSRFPLIELAIPILCNPGAASRVEICRRFTSYDWFMKMCSY